MNAQDVDLVRNYIGNPSEAWFADDDHIQAAIDRTSGDLFAAAAELWGVRAAFVTEEINVADFRTKIDLEKIFDHCLKMAEYYEDRAGNVSGAEMTNFGIRVTPIDKTETSDDMV